ncbi:MAG: DUF4249 domain-containing protein [Flavobacteriales bacterium]
MKKNVYILLFIPLLISSCIKEVEIELNDTEPKLVVEALLTDNIEPYKVKLTLLSPFFDQSGEHYITNAQVYITDDLGNTDTLYYTQNGIYATLQNQQGMPGITYALKVIYNGEEYNATETMQPKSTIDTVSYIYNEGSAFIEEGYNVILNFQDDGSYSNYYRFSFYKNDTLQTDPFKYFVVDDIPVQGNYIIAQVPYNYQPGDSARVELQNITKEYYLYLTAISTQIQSSGGPFDPIPANPPTNITNGGLGFFAVLAKDEMTIVLP